MSILDKEFDYHPIEYFDFYIKRRYFDNPAVAAQGIKRVIESYYSELIKFRPHASWDHTTPEEQQMANTIGNRIMKHANKLGHINFIFRCEEHEGRRFFMFRFVNSVLDMTIVDVEFFA